MTDIVKDLQTYLAARAGVERTYYADHPDVLINRAADEIERLQKRCDTLEQLLQPNPEALYRLAMGRKITEDRA